MILGVRVEEFVGLREWLTEVMFFFLDYIFGVWVFGSFCFNGFKFIFFFWFVFLRGSCLFGGFSYFISS